MSTKKKGAKKEKKEAPPPADTQALVDAQMQVRLWAVRFELSERSRREHRSNAATLLKENEALQTKIAAMEGDTIEVIQHLKREISVQQREAGASLEALKEAKRAARRDRDALADDYTNQIRRLEEKLQEKEDKITVLTNELALLKDFKNKRAQLEKDLEQLKESAEQAQLANAEKVRKMEAKYLEERVRMQKETDQLLAEMSEKAIADAMLKLDETTRQTYRENARLTESLHKHIEESADLRKRNAALQEEIHDQRLSRSGNDTIVKDAILKSKLNEKYAEQARIKIEMLETSLSHVVREFELERSLVAARNEDDTKGLREELDRQQQALDVKSAEIKRIKKLARTILEQRSEIETFFLEAMTQVKQEIASSRAEYLKDAQAAYSRQVEASLAAGTALPKIKTFSKNATSSNSIQAEFQAADAQTVDLSTADLQTMTWEQRERVLQVLLTRLRGQSTAPRPPASSAPITSAPTMLALPPTRRRPADRLPAITPSPVADESDSSRRSVFLTDPGYDPSFALAGSRLLPTKPATPKQQQQQMST
eukprot:m.220197 g.220197  ORF g.220197 m.220197 type:complete len:543 (-) comp54143_c0_seq1:118-1746(-)